MLIKILIPPVLAIALSFAQGCGSGFPNEPGLVKRLRVAAIVADKPEVKPGEIVRLTAYVIDPKTGRFGLTWGIEQDLKPLILGEGQSLDWTAPAAETVQIIALYAQDETGDHEAAVKKIVVSNNPEPNRNPLCAIIAVPDPVIGVPVKGKVTLRMEATDPDPADQGNLRVAWMITRGGLSDDTDPVVVWTAPSEPGFYTAYGAVRDMRGGVALSSVLLKVFRP